MKSMLTLLAVAGAFVLLTRSVPANPIGVVVDHTSDGVVVTANTEAATIHFSYDQSCADSKPCYTIDASQGMVGISASASSCTVKNGNGYTPTIIQCPPAGVGSIQFKFVKGGTWSAYSGGGGQHTGTSCSPARVIVTAGKGVTSIESWDGCHEIVQCGSLKGSLATVDADANDDITGKCASIVKH